MTSTSICSSARQGLFDLWLYFFGFVAYETTTNLFGNITPSWSHLLQKEHTTTLILYCVWVP